MKPAIGPKLKARRLELGLTQLEVAKAAGVSRRTVINAEQGHCIPDVLTLLDLLKVLKLKAGEVLK